MKKPAIIFIAVCFVLWLLAFPALNDYANAGRLMPGVGGEMLLPIFPVLGVWFWEHRHDLDIEDDE